MISDFEKRRANFDRSFRMHKLLMVGMVIVALGIITTKFVIAYQAGCLPSYVLHEVCLSQPTIDGAIKDVIGK
jgi:hypothetical protein